MITTASTLLAVVTLAGVVLSPHAAGNQLLSKVSNRLIPKLFKHINATKEENVVFSSVGLLQNLAVISSLTNDTGVTHDILHVLGLDDTLQLEKLRQELQHVLTNFEIEANEGENTTEATGLFNYLHVNPEHKLTDDLSAKLMETLRTNVTYDTSLEGGTFTASADVGVLSAWQEREALAVFTLLQHSAESPFTLHNGSIRVTPLVPHVGRLGTREHTNFTLVRLPLQAANTRLVLILPKTSEEFNFLVDAMPDVMPLMDAGENREEVALWIPQMLAISSIEMKPILQQFGAKSLFSADFSGVTKSEDPLVLNSISQKSFFSTSFTSIKSITESGTNFVAETKEFRRKRRQTDSKSLVFNRPFLFFIERSDLRLVLTAGCINDPTQFPIYA